MKKGNSFSGYIILAVAVLSHLFAFVDYLFIRDSFPIPSHWDIQTYSLLIVSIMCSAFLLLSSKFHLLLLGLKFTAVLLIGFPLGEYLGIEIILLIALIIETVYHLPIIPGGIWAISFLTILFLAQKPSNSWGYELNRADMHSLLFMLFASLLIFFLSLYLKQMSNRIKEKNRDLGRLDFAVKELSRINLDYQTYAQTIEQDSIENERKRISREIHDIIGYTLTNQLMIIQAALSMKDELPKQLKGLLDQAQVQTNEGMEEARMALRKLRDFNPRKESGTGLIYKLAKTFEEVTGVSVSTDFGNSPRTFGKEIDSVLYRTVQESLTNSFRHGKATKIDITFFVNEHILNVGIWDNGIGAETINEGIGFKGMKERLDGLGGRLKASPMPGGFSLTVTIPMKENNQS